MQSKWEAYRILEFDTIYDIPFDQVKKRYRVLALKHHPDKSRDPNSKERFIEIQEAYRFLDSTIGNSFHLNDFDEPTDSSETSHSYDAMMDAFLTSVKPEYALLIKKLLRVLSSASVKDFLKRVNRETVAKMYEFMSQYKDVFHFNETEFTAFSENTSVDAAASVPTDTIIYVLNPYIEDLMGDNVFRLKHQDRTYLVPLWHPETVFEDDAGEEFRVCCYPILPDNMDIDDANIITLWFDIKVAEIWNRDTLEVQVGGQPVKVPTETLRLTDQIQEVIIPNAGIPIANSMDVFDASQRQPIHVCVRLLL